MTPNPCDCSVLSHVAQLVTHCSHSLLMTAHARVLISSSHGIIVQARVLIDSASSLFISEHLTHLMQLPRSKRSAQITGIGGMSHESTSQVTVYFLVLFVWTASENGFKVEAVVLPRVTCDLQTHPIYRTSVASPCWTSNLQIPVLTHPARSISFMVWMYSA